ncbi:MAG TPA: DGQHR domain-containing protein [Acidimicrobiales bacterium]|nr:DGQHR domain-containing protein [Acidimicrobiales bacterium]
MKLTQNRFTFYSAVVPGKALLHACFVSRRTDDPLEGFNRSLSRTRAIDIARYLERGFSIPTNIILSAQPEGGLEFSRGKVSWEEVPGRSFLVIDGQHRLFSMEHTERDFQFVVAIYNELSRQDEVQLFIDINTNQKGVPPALLLDIKQLAGSETTLEEKLRRLFDALAADRSTPLYGRFSPSAKASGKISRVTFNTALRKPVEAGVLAAMPVEDQAKLIANYLVAADRVVVSSGARNNDLTKATILQAFFEIFNDVADQTLARAGNLRPNALTETLAPLNAIDFDAYLGSNRPSKAKLVADMRQALITPPPVTADML